MPSVQSYLDSLPSKDRQLVFKSLKELFESDNPVSVSGVRKLVEKKYDGKWRTRAGKYRIIFSIKDGTLIVHNSTYKGVITIHEVFLRNDGY